MKRKKLQLTDQQVQFLKEFKQKRARSLPQINRANILLLLAKGKAADEIACFLDVGRNTVSRTKQQCIREGLEAALGEPPPSGPAPQIQTTPGG